MSNTDRGSQDITFDFKHPLQGKEFNKLLRGIVKHGIYQGGGVSITTQNVSNDSITIQPFQAVLNVGTDKTVNIVTDTVIELTCNNTAGPQSASDTLLIMRYVWDDVIQNYIDFEYEDESTYTPLDTDVVVCKITYSSYPAISALSTEERTSGLFDTDYNVIVENTLKTDTIQQRNTGNGINLGGSALFVDEANTRVGINDVTPSYTLDINGTVRTTGAVTFDSTLNVTGNIISAGETAGNIQIGITGNNEIDTSSGNLTIDSSGGTTTIDDICTISGLLNANGGIAVDTSNFTVSGSTGAVVMANTLNVYSNRFNVGSSEVVVNEGGVDLDFRVESNSDTHALFVEGSSSNVGVGGVSDGSKIHVESTSNSLGKFKCSTPTGVAQVFVANDDNSALLVLSCTGSSYSTPSGIFTVATPIIHSTASTGLSIAASHASGDINFTTGGYNSARLKIDSSGNVGIGKTPSGSYLLDVNTNAYFGTDIRVDGTATLDTVDINAGAIDGVTIGGNSAGAGTFTSLNVSNGNIILDAVTTYPAVRGSGYSLRDRGPAGGWICYDKGSYSDGWRYLEAAPEETEMMGVLWMDGDYDLVTTGATGTAVGTGYVNTFTIISAVDSSSTTDALMYPSAALGARAVCYGGHGDWFLPSKDELNKMYVNLHSGTDENSDTYTPVGGFGDIYYWSSSEDSAILAWGQYFTNGSQGNYNKDSGLRVRCVRAF